jgi:hypothetical protein
MKTINEQIAELERVVQETIDAWTQAKLNRNDVQIKELEEQLVNQTTALNDLKMRRPV